MSHRLNIPVTVGSKEYIDLPDLGFAGIPSRIDTGAQKSSIWASNIHIEDGKLVFNLFAPGSAYYRDEPIVSDNYRSTIVRNSFGNEEFRYMARLRVRLGGHTLMRWFSLADRSNNNYPVLIGRNFLHGKFLVNVSDAYVHGQQETPRIFIFTSNAPATRRFFTTVKQENKKAVEYVCTSYNSLVFYIDGINTRVINTDDDDTDIATYALTYFKSHHNHEIAQAAAEYLRYKGREFVDQELIDSLSASKLSEYMKLACHNVPVPPVICASASLLRQKFTEIEKNLGVPFVLKAAGSDKGRNNYLIEAYDDFAKVLSDDHEGLLWIVQKYIPNDGFYRMYVLGKYVALAIRRNATPHLNPLKRHLNKPRGSANAFHVPLAEVPAEAQALALQAAACMNRQIAGVDLLQDKSTGKWYILEANNDPQIRTGSFVEDKARAIAEFIDRKLG